MRHLHESDSTYDRVCVCTLQGSDLNYTWLCVCMLTNHAGRAHFVGCAVDDINTHSQQTPMAASSLWSHLSTMRKGHDMCGCAYFESTKDANVRAGTGHVQPGRRRQTASTDTGVVRNHAYAILAAQQKTKGERKPVQLIQVRNPWGHQSFSGQYANDSEFWSKKENRAHFKYNPGNEHGLFWVTPQEMLTAFNRLHVCRAHPMGEHNNSGKGDSCHAENKNGPQTYTAIAAGAWEGATAGGHDGHITWRNNPCFEVSASPDTDLSFTLIQPDVRQAARESDEAISYHQVGITVCSLLNTISAKQADPPHPFALAKDQFKVCHAVAPMLHFRK